MDRLKGYYMNNKKYCISDAEFVKIAYEDYENFKQAFLSLYGEAERIIDFCKIFSLKNRKSTINDYDEKINKLKNKLTKITDKISSVMNVIKDDI